MTFARDWNQTVCCGKKKTQNGEFRPSKSFENQLKRSCYLQSFLVLYGKVLAVESVIDFVRYGLQDSCPFLYNPGWQCHPPPPPKVCIPKKWVWLKKKKKSLRKRTQHGCYCSTPTLLVAEQTRVAALIIPSDAPRCATLCLLWLQGYVPGRSVPTPAVGRCSRTRTPTQRLTKRCRPLRWQRLSSSSNSKCEAWLFRTSCRDSNYKKKKCEMISSTASCLARSAQNKYLFYSSVNLSLGFCFFFICCS